MSVKTLAQKLLSVQKVIGSASKSSTNPHFKSKYADLNEVLDVAKEALHTEGLFIVQAPGGDTAGKFLETSILDADSGQQVSGRVYFSGNEDNMQKIGAAITYARRFGLKALLAMEDEDDDGETSVGRRGTVSKSVLEPTPSPSPKTSAPVPAKVGAGPTKKTLLEKITLTSKVLIDSKRMTYDEVLALLTAFKVKSKEELTDEQAKELLTQMETRLK